MEMINTEVKEMERVQREIDGLTEGNVYFFFNNKLIRIFIMKLLLIHTPDNSV